MINTRDGIIKVNSIMEIIMEMEAPTGELMVDMETGVKIIREATIILITIITSFISRMMDIIRRITTNGGKCKVIILVTTITNIIMEPETIITVVEVDITIRLTMNKVLEI